MVKSCWRCHGPVEITTLDKVSAENKPLTVSVAGMPVAECRHGHASPVASDFMIWLIHELKDRETALAARSEQGLVFKKYRCACGAELAAEPARTGTFPLDLAYAGAPPFKAELAMPVYQCTGCGKEQLRSHKAIQGHTSRAIALLNDAAGFPHSG